MEMKIEDLRPTREGHDPGASDLPKDGEWVLGRWLHQAPGKKVTTEEKIVQPISRERSYG